MPQLSANTNKPAEVENKLRRKKKKRASRPAPKVQPGPISDAENRKVERHKTKPSYRKTIRKARVHGGQGRRGTSPAPDSHDTERGRKVSDAAIKAARLRVLKRRNKGSGTRAIKRELEGKGALAKTFGENAEKVGPTVGKLAVKATRAPRPKKFQTAHSQAVDKATAEIFARGAKDLANFPAQAIPSVYVPVAAAYEAAKGDTSRGKKFLKDIDENDPVWNTIVAGVEKAGGDSKAAKKRIKVAGESAAEHPGFTALEVAGVKGFVGRTSSKAMRGGGRTVRKVGKVTGSKKVEDAGEKVRKAGSTERKPRKVAGTNIVEERTYSRDSFTKARQVLEEKTARRSTRRLNKQADRAEGKGHTDNARELREDAARKDPDRVSEREIKKRVDERIQVNEDIRRKNRDETSKQARKIVRSAKGGKDAVAVVAQRITRADKKDIADYIRELEAEAPGLSHSKLAANKQLRKQLQSVVDDPKVDMAKVQRAANDYAQLVGGPQKRLGDLGALDPDQVTRAAVIPYAVRKMGAKHDPEVGAVVAKDGSPLPTTAIVKHMKEHGEDPAAWVTQAPSARGAKNFNVRPERPVRASAGKRTGEATRKGTFDADPDVLVESAARSQGLVDAAEGFREIVREFSVRGGSGRPKTFANKKQADNAARDAMFDKDGNPKPGAHALRPVRISPFGGTKRQLEALLDDVENLDAEQAREIGDAIEDAIRGKDGDGPWALISEAAAERMSDHLNSQGGGGGIKTLQLANQTFRRTVLATSPTWFAGNIIEGLGRAALGHAGPRSWVTGRKTLGQLRDIDPKMADEAVSRLVGGGHFTSAERGHIRRGAQQFDGTNLAPIANALGKFWRSPGPKQAAGMWHAWTEFVFKSLNGRIENQIQTAMLGAALRKSPLMDQKVLKLSGKAIGEAAQGLTKTEAQVRFGREVDRMYGRYGKFSPAERKLISTYTPFLAWWMNSVNFVFRVLPKDHPVVTGLIASAEIATDEWRKDHGLDLFMDKAVPGFLQGSIPTGDGGKLRASRFTPFGAFTDPTGTVASQVMPLWSSVAAPLTGRDWTGRELTVKGEDGKRRELNPFEKAVAAGAAFVGATVPIYSQGKRVAEEGPGVLNPFRVTRPPKQKLKVSKPGAGTGRRKVQPTEKGFFGGSGSSPSSGSSGSFFGGEKKSTSSSGGFFD